MLRSIVAIIVAVIAGLAVARTVEAVGLAAIGAPQREAYAALLLAGWCMGAFAATGIALLIAQRWAPVGALAAATMLLQALLSGAAFGPLLIVVAALLIAGAGYGAILLTRATWRRAAPKQAPFP